MPDPVERLKPLFYRKPQPLIPAIHDDVRLVAGDFGFAQETNAVPITIVEFAAAMRHYPIVFAEGGSFPLATLGLGKANRFVADGDWADGHYVPAYVRRYPFVFADAGDQGFALALDVMSERVVQNGDEGVALFEAGLPTTFTQNAMAFCRDFHQAHLATIAFVQALAEHGLLTSRRADANFIDAGGPMTLTGFRVIDREKVAQLADDVILDWHRRGWLELVAFHLASLERFADLFGREREAIGKIAMPDLAHPDPVASESFDSGTAAA